jgi:hypothetical protein
MFLGLEAIDEEGLKRYRKRVTLSKNFEALELLARSIYRWLSISLPIPWDRERFKVVDWCLEIPRSSTSALTRLIPAQKRGIPNRVASRRALPAIRHSTHCVTNQAATARIYKELVETQRVLSRKHLAGRRCETARVSLSASCFAVRPILSECFDSTAYITRNSNWPITANW